MIFYIALALLVMFTIFLAFSCKKSGHWDDFWLAFGWAAGVFAVVFLVVLPIVSFHGFKKHSYEIDDATIHHMKGLGANEEYYFISDGDKYSLGDSDDDINFSVGSENVAVEECTQGGNNIFTPLSFWTDCNWTVVAESSGN